MSFDIVFHRIFKFISDDNKFLVLENIGSLPVVNDSGMYQKKKKLIITHFFGSSEDQYPSNVSCLFCCTDKPCHTCHCLKYKVIN